MYFIEGMQESMNKMGSGSGFTIENGISFYPKKWDQVAQQHSNVQRDNMYHSMFVIYCVWGKVYFY